MGESVVVLVPTWQRPRELATCLGALQEQTFAPSCVVVAGVRGDLGTAEAISAYRSRGDCLNVVFVTTDDPGVAQQRNVGLEHLPAHATWVLLMDDDVVPRPDYIERLLRTGAEIGPRRLAGIAGVAEEASHVRVPRRRDGLSVWFCLAARENLGQLLRSGVNIPPAVAGPPATVGWLFGGAMYRAPVARALRFFEGFGSYALYDDVDYSLQAAEHGRLYVDPAARLQHRHSQGNRPNARALASKSIANRWLLVARHPQRLSLTLFWWSVIGALLCDSASLLKRRDRESLQRLGGRTLGACRATRTSMRSLLRAASVQGRRR